MSGQHGIRLFLADVDGTLLTQEKVLTDAAKAAAHELHKAGIIFAITSGRPPAGMKMLIEPLALTGAIAGFNGGVFVNPDLSVIESHTLDPAVAKQTLKLILDQGLDAWVYTETEWLVRDPKDVVGVVEAQLLQPRNALGNILSVPLLENNQANAPFFHVRPADLAMQHIQAMVDEITEINIAFVR